MWIGIVVVCLNRIQFGTVAHKEKSGYRAVEDVLATLIKRRLAALVERDLTPLIHSTSAYWWRDRSEKSTASGEQSCIGLSQYVNQESQRLDGDVWLLSPIVLCLTRLGSNKMADIPAPGTPT